MLSLNFLLNKNTDNNDRIHINHCSHIILNDRKNGSILTIARCISLPSNFIVAFDSFLKVNKYKIAIMIAETDATVIDKRLVDSGASRQTDQ